MMEGQIFNNLKLGKSQQLEDFHSQILEKGNLLHKPDHEVLARFIEGLPEKNGIFRTSWPTSRFVRCFNVC